MGNTSRGGSGTEPVMTDLQQGSNDHSRAVFSGLTPRLPREAELPTPRNLERGRVAKGVFSTGSVLLVGSMAAMTMNLTAPIESADALQPQKSKGAATQNGSTVREAMAASAAARAAAVAAVTAVTAAPDTYIVQAGDTISAIAGRHGLATASVLALNGLSWSSLIFPGQELRLASAASSAAPAPASTPPPAPAATSAASSYTIVGGDTISGIARRFGVSTQSVLTANGLSGSSIIYPGQSVTIPGSGAPALNAVPVAAVSAAPAAPAAVAPVAGNYLIVSGDTVGKIAARFGISTQDLLAANGLSATSVIYAGRSLVIPAAGVIPASTGAATPVAPGSVTSLNSEMRANAAVIVQVGRELGVPDYGIIIALATAMQESTMRNLTWGDRDSVGLFQQRPSAGWGSVQQLTTPAHAARLFYGGPSNPNRGYTRGLLDIAGWQNMTVTQAAQKVQLSAFPDAYAKWESSARAWFGEL